MSTLASVVEHTDIVRKRRFAVRSIADVSRVFNLLALEKFQGSVRIDVACGGIPTSAEVEERQGIPLTTGNGSV